MSKLQSKNVNTKKIRTVLIVIAFVILVIYIRNYSVLIRLTHEEINSGKNRNGMAISLDGKSKSQNDDYHQYKTDPMFLDTSHDASSRDSNKVIETYPIKRTKKQNIRPTKRKIQKIYYVDSKSNRHRQEYMERWLEKESVPYQRVEGGANFCNTHLSIMKTHVSEKAPVLVLDDDFKVFNKTLGRIERALRWVPGDFHVVRFDCLFHGDEMVWYDDQDGFEIWTMNKTDSELQSDCFYRGGTHAIIWRSMKLDTFRRFFEYHPGKTRAEVDCLLSSKELNSYCINFDTTHRIGCFHNIKRSIKNTKSNHVIIQPESRNEYKERNFSLSGETLQYRYTTNAIHNKNFWDPLPTILVGVLSSPDGFELRQAIRETWGHGYSVYFVIAGSWDNVEWEFYTYHDILWLDTAEDYRAGLRRKTMTFIDFGAFLNRDVQQATPFDFLFKTDDDMYVNITQLRTDLSLPISSYNCSVPCEDGDDDNENNNNPLDKNIHYFGLMMHNSRPVRDPGSKFYTSKEMYPEDSYPAYATGAGYALSSVFAECASEKLSTLQPLWWEDVSTGLLAAACNVKLVRSHWYRELVDWPYPIYQVGGKHVSLVHNINADEMRRLHQHRRLPFNGDWYKSDRVCPVEVS